MSLPQKQQSSLRPAISLQLINTLAPSLYTSFRLNFRAVSVRSLTVSEKKCILTLNDRSCWPLIKYTQERGSPDSPPITRRDKSLFKTWSEPKVQRVFAKMNSHYKLIDHTPMPIIKIPILPKLLFFHKCQELLVTFCTILKFYSTSFIEYHLGSPRSPGNTRKSGWSCKAKVLRIS